MTFKTFNINTNGALNPSRLSRWVTVPHELIRVGILRTRQFF